jgi:AcrR family transcriptional regulator
VTDRRRPEISSRKQPKQTRSTDLVAAVLEAAVEVLAKEGAQRFTTARVAEQAGVSVGSLYQYFPNKAAILFRLQSDEWRQTTELLRGILEDVQRGPLERLRILVHAFICSECKEAAVRVALDDAAPAMRPRRGRQGCEEPARSSFLCKRRALAGDLITTTLSQVGKHFSESPQPPRRSKLTPTLCRICFAHTLRD